MKQGSTSPPLSTSPVTESRRAVTEAPCRHSVFASVQSSFSKNTKKPTTRAPNPASIVKPTEIPRKRRNPGSPCCLVSDRQSQICAWDMVRSYDLPSPLTNVKHCCLSCLLMVTVWRLRLKLKQMSQMIVGGKKRRRPTPGTACGSSPPMDNLLNSFLPRSALSLYPGSRRPVW